MMMNCMRLFNLIKKFLSARFSSIKHKVMKAEAQKTVDPAILGAFIGVILTLSSTISYFGY